MTATDGVFGVGPRVKAWLDQTYPKGRRAKGIMADLAVSEGLAAKLLRGYAPRMWLFEEMVALWDGPFLAHIFPEALAAGDARLRELEAEIRALRADLDQGRRAAPALDDPDAWTAPAVSPAEDEDPAVDAAQRRVWALARGLAGTIPAAYRGGTEAA
jgi:hypothetical protein